MKVIGPLPPASLAVWDEDFAIEQLERMMRGEYNKRRLTRGMRVQYMHPEKIPELRGLVGVVLTDPPEGSLVTVQFEGHGVFNLPEKHCVESRGALRRYPQELNFE